MDATLVFKALADPSRRLLLDRLFERDGRSLGELESELEMTRFGVMKHLRQLEDAGLLTTRKVGRTKLHYLNPVPIRLIHDRWIDKYTAPHVAALAGLKRELEGDTMEAAIETKPKQVYQVVIKATPEQVWDAITKPEFISKYFFGSRLESSLVPGEPWLSYSPDRSQLWVEGTVLEADPPRRLSHTWRTLYDPECADDAPSRVTYEIEPMPNGLVKLTAVHDGFEGETKTYRNVAGGWSYVLSSLKTLLETGEALPPFAA